MKRWILTLMLALFALPAAAQEDALPAGVKALCDKAYPAYILAAHDGWGDETQGQYALVLTDGEDNILCIAEKAAGDAAYAFTVENTNAVREGAQIPSLLIDTGGDSLFYSYWDYDMYKYSYHCEKRNGEWGKVSLEYLDTGYVNYDMNIWVGASGDVLAYDVNHFDKRENPVAFDKPVYMDIPISDAFASQLQLEWFDIAMLSPEPGLISPYPGLCGPLLEEGDELHELNVQEDTLIMLVKKADGTKRLRITDGWDDYKNDYAVVETGPLPGEAGMDTWHGSARTTIHLVLNGGDIFNFGRAGDGKWYLSSVQAQEGFSLYYNAVRSWEDGGIYRNDGTVYGASPWSADITKLDLTKLPTTFEEAAAQLDTSVYAVVNNPNPADRLHLRGKPDKKAASYGKFYNRTPVYVLGVEGEWAHVRIGNETDGREGYMMKKFLAFGKDKESVKCAFPEKFILENADGEPVINLKRAPSREAFRTINSMDGTDGWWIIGVMDEDWYIILTDDGAVGYALQSLFFDGNG